MDFVYRFPVVKGNSSGKRILYWDGAVKNDFETIP